MQSLWLVRNNNSLISFWAILEIEMGAKNMQSIFVKKDLSNM